MKAGHSQKVALALVFVGLLALPPLASGAESWVGKQIMPKRSGLKIGYTDQDGQARYVATLTQTTYPVEEEQGSWIRVSQGDASGWFAKKDAVLMEDAVRYFTSLIRQNERDVDAYFRRAEAWKARKEYDIAIKDYDDAIRLQPEQPLWYNNRASLWFKKGDYERAVADYDEAIRLDSNNLMFLYNRGLVWAYKGELDKALADYDEVIRRNPTDVRALNSRANVWQLKKEYDRAIADYDEVIRLNPDFAWGYNNRGLVWLAKREYDQALADFDEAIRLDPKDGWIFYNRGRTWGKKYEFGRALADLDEAIRLSPKNAQILNQRAWLQAVCSDGRYRDGKKAVASAKQACDLTAWKNPYFIETLAAAYAEAGEFELAVKWQKRAIEDEVGIDGQLPEVLAAARARLERYQDHKPYHEKAAR